LTRIITCNFFRWWSWLLGLDLW